MPPTAWRRALRHRVTVKRNTTTVSASGASKFNYAPVATAVPCSLQDSGGRMRQDDVGQEGLRRKTAVFGPEMDAVIQQNDLIVLENFDVGQTYRLTHVHFASDGIGPHIEAIAEQWIPSGSD